MTYFYVFKGDEKIILTLDNFETEGNTIVHAFGQGAHFVEGLHLPLEEKIKVVLTLPLLDVAEGAKFLAQVAADSEGYNPDSIKQPFNGSLKEFFQMKFRETFGFGVSQLFNIDQCRFLDSMDWADVERRYVNRLGGLIPCSFLYGDTEWVIPDCFEM
jgi:hypothetical protein